MNLHKWKLTTYSIVGASAFLYVAHFCYMKTQGFRLPEILSSIPNDESWNFPPLSEREYLNIQSLLAQPFSYFGKGDQCYVFLGQDKKTILKFFKHEYTILPPTIKSHYFLKTPLHLLFPKMCLKERHLLPLFESSKIAYTFLKNETGLLLLHLNKTSDQFPTVEIKDAIGVSHKVELDTTEFILQSKADLLFSHLENTIQTKPIKEAKKLIRSIFEVISERCDKGIRNMDCMIGRNFGFVEGRPVELDTGSFVHDETLKSQEGKSAELQRQTKKLKHWLSRKHPELYTYYLSQLEFWSSDAKQSSVIAQALGRGQ